MTQPTREQFEKFINGIDDETDLYTPMSDESFDTGRWLDFRSIVVRHELSGKYYAADYEQGLTEIQLDDDKFVRNIREVRPVEVTVIEYKDVK